MEQTKEAKRAALAELDARIRALRAARAELAKAPCGWGEVGDVRRLTRNLEEALVPVFVGHGDESDALATIRKF